MKAWSDIRSLCSGVSSGSFTFRGVCNTRHSPRACEHGLSEFGQSGNNEEHIENAVSRPWVIEMRIARSLPSRGSGEMQRYVACGKAPGDEVESDVRLGNGFEVISTDRVNV
ncbi:hypothetical protein DOTSEDRAFT_47786 [Dothistroma septosporum NZE10]|uniref:Uncharacterized protein n=1 Tax=Dothistroma septosporum (strain NZE10 / CBS 128990) TaxID=675120 RepID=M2Y1I3_DOTSN|nr:hypothetical protein DOTSEDRAFT_47786 [Dothistroma septosporum NZE10]